MTFTVGTKVGPYEVVGALGAGGMGVGILDFGLPIWDHNLAMRQVRIAELKSRLSEYLRAVRGGETIAVPDRETPVARIVPVREGAALKIRKPAPGMPAPNRIPLPKPVKLKIDVVELLLEERRGHR